MKKKRVLITGEAGNMARGISHYLRSHKAFELIDQRELEPFQRTVGGHHQWPEIDVASSSLGGVFKMIRPDLVIHAAAVVNTDKCESRPEDCIRSNLTGTHWVLRACQEVGAKLLYISTTATYRPNSLELRWTHALRETSFQEPKTIYGITKYAGELLVTGQREIEWLVVRPCFIFGDPPYDHSSQLVRVAVHTYLRKKAESKAGPRPVVTLDPKNWKDYMRLEDFARAVVAILEKGATYEAYNVSYGEPRPVADYFAALEGFLGTKLHFEWAPKRDYLGNHVIDSTKLLRETGWKPMFHPIKDGLERTAMETKKYVRAALKGEAPLLYQ